MSFLKPQVTQSIFLSICFAQQWFKRVFGEGRTQWVYLPFKLNTKKWLKRFLKIFWMSEFKFYDKTNNHFLKNLAVPFLQTPSTVFMIRSFLLCLYHRNQFPTYFPVTIFYPFQLIFYISVGSYSKLVFPDKLIYFCAEQLCSVSSKIKSHNPRPQRA